MKGSAIVVLAAFVLILYLINTGRWTALANAIKNPGSL